ncbi:MAG: hypothetical protein ACXV3D_07535 [Halobacteriota archaeon]
MAAGANGPQKEKTEFSVTYQGTVTGTLSISAKQQTFAFTGKGLAPNTKYYLSSQEGARLLGSGTSTNAGALQIKGTWDGIATGPMFILTLTPPSSGEECTATGISAKDTNHVFWGTLSGTLAGQDPYLPLPGQTISYYVVIPYMDGGHGIESGSTTTGSSGTFQVVFALASINYASSYVKYEGGTYNGVTYCSSADNDLEH